MACFDRDEFTRRWLATTWGDEAPAGADIPLMDAPASEPETDIMDPELPRGYIIRDWFGPFLLSPSRRYERCRC